MTGGAVDLANAGFEEDHGWNCADGMGEAHDWQYKRSWSGDPDAINGPCDIYYKVCRVCGKEADWDGSDFARSEP